MHVRTSDDNIAISFVVNVNILFLRKLPKKIYINDINGQAFLYYGFGNTF